MADRHQVLKPVLIGGDDERHRIAAFGELANLGVAIARGALAQSFAGRALLIGERFARETDPALPPKEVTNCGSWAVFASMEAPPGVAMQSEPIFFTVGYALIPSPINQNR